MGIYLPNMEMPKNCEACELAKHFDGYQENDCPFNAFSYYDCPLIPVQEPHGRLGDLDALPWYLANTSVKYETYEDWEMLCDAIATAPTVIPASEEG